MDAAKLSLREQMQEITARLEQGVREIFANGQYSEYLQLMSRFHSYSFRNSFLIFMQKPEATRVAGFTTWKNSFGRNVKKGEKGIRIFAPAPYKKVVEESRDNSGIPYQDADGNPTTKRKEITVPSFKAVYVFDLSQTEGRELPNVGIPELMGDVKNYDVFFEAVKQASPVPVTFEEMGKDTDGYFSPKEKKIALRWGMSEVETALAAIHEITHATLHDSSRKDNKQERPQDSRTQEVEAESVAYTVCQHYGIEAAANSFAYVANWSSDKALSELQASLETIQKTAAALIGSIDAQLDILQAKDAAQEQPTTDFSYPAVRLDAPFIPTIEILNTSRSSINHGAVQYQILDAGYIYPIDESDKDFFPVKTVDLDTGEKITVGFSDLREYTFDAVAYRQQLFENDNVQPGVKNLSFAGHTGAWDIVDKTSYKDDTYYVAAQMSANGESPKYLITDQSGSVVRDSVFFDFPLWEHSDLIHLVNNLVTERHIEQVNGAVDHGRNSEAIVGEAILYRDSKIYRRQNEKVPFKLPISERLATAKKAVESTLPKPLQRVKRAEMEK